MWYFRLHDKMPVFLKQFFSHFQMTRTIRTSFLFEKKRKKKQKKQQHKTGKGSLDLVQIRNVYSPFFVKELKIR